MGFNQGNNLWEIVKQEKTNHTAFWGDYENLNSYPIPSDDMSFRLQLSRLRGRALSEKTSSLSMVNQYIQTINNTSPDSLLKLTEDYTTQQLLKDILSILNSAFISSSNSLKMEHFNRDEVTGKFSYKNKNISQARANFKQAQEDLVGQLEQLLNLISYPIADSKILDGFRAGLRGTWNKSLRESTGFSNYKAFKAAQAEQLMVHILNQHPGWHAIVTGQFIKKGEQLLEDAFVFNDIGMEMVFDQNFSITIRDKKTGQTESHKVNSLQQFFNLANSLNVNETLVFSDDGLYETLQKISIMKAQAKSSFQLQSLINETKHRSAISIEKTGSCLALNQLYELYNLDWINSNSSASVAALANYCLSKATTLTTLMGNDIYFTRDGFITASDWMQTYSYMLKFNPAADIISSGYLSQVRPYSLQPVKN